MKISREKFRTEHGVFDRFTIQTLQKLESEGFFQVDSLQPMFIGKESNVFIGEGKRGTVAVKIYRLENNDFHGMYTYLVRDLRLAKVKHRKRDVIMTWVKREYSNLLRARSARVRVPTVYAVRNNVMVMEFIHANKLKDEIPKDPLKFYVDLCKQIKKMVKADLVHGDLSHFNILNFEEKPVLIDMSQSTTIESPHAKEYFVRDMRIVNKFFSRLGVEDKDLKTVLDFLK